MYIKSLSKAVSVIELIAANGCLSLEQVHILLDIPKPTLKRILDDFEELGWVYRRLADKKYVILKDLIGNCSTSYQQAKDVSEVLVDLFCETGCPSDFLISSKSGVTILESSFGLMKVRKTAEHVIGSTLSPTLSASGRAYLSQLVDAAEQQGAMLPYSEEFLKILEQEKQQGFFTRVPGSWEFNFAKPFDVRSVALPIGQGKDCIGCLSLYWDGNKHRSDRMAERFVPSMEKSVSRILKITADGFEQHA